MFNRTIINDDSGRENSTKSIRLGGQQEWDEGHQDEEVPEWGRREPECHWGVGCVEQYP